MPEHRYNTHNMTVIGLYGYSESGKTTLIERLIRDLQTEGYRVAAVKVSGHTINMDEAGKDTWRYSQAGAGTVALTAANSTTIMVSPSIDVPTILLALDAIQHPDVVLVEGVREVSVRKIRLGEIEERRNTIWTYDGIYEHLLQRVHQELIKE